MKSKPLGEIIGSPKKELVRLLWTADPEIKKILSSSSDLSAAREDLFNYLNSLEREYYNIHSVSELRTLHILWKKKAIECICMLRNVIRTENEKRTGFSTLQVLFDLANKRKEALEGIGEGFLCELLFCFKGLNGRFGASPDVYTLKSVGGWGARERSKSLDLYSQEMTHYFARYKSGSDPALIESSTQMRDKILDFFGGSDSDWPDYKWHLKHIITDSKTLSSLVSISEEELEGVLLAEQNKIPFQITPYYLSLFNPAGKCFSDRTVRAQVLPSARYCESVLRDRREGADLDFMGERSTSPVVGVTRRYPQIVVFKPFDSCPQICVYCQRNWEIKDIKEARVSSKRIEKALLWLSENHNISEVLLTGGDPLTLDNGFIDSLISRIAEIDHIERIRIGSRVPVTLPYRIDEGLLGILEKYHEWGSREICFVTHFEHARELTPDSVEAIKKLRGIGLGVYNQQVFTYFNSFKFETCFLRKALKLSGIDPYYTFNTKGKEETVDFRVPIARILQERREEARLLPGIVRTDEPVFNVPKLGKSHLREWQQHEPIMVLPDGSRVYRFLPWESKIAEASDYLYTDVPIYDYLRRLKSDGENLEDYRSIWYYF